MLAASHAGYRAVFEDLGLDYYSTGHLSLDDAARGAGLDPCAVRAAMQRVADSQAGPNWLDRPLRELIEHLDREHHQLLRSSVFKTAVLLDDAYRQHGDACLGTLRHDFRVFSEELLNHIEEEEVSLFPVAISLDESWVRGEPLLADRDKVQTMVTHLLCAHGTIARNLDVLMRSHDAVSAIADETCKKVLENIESIERHVHAYLNLENHVVYPRAIALAGEAAEVPA